MNRSRPLTSSTEVFFPRDSGNTLNTRIYKISREDKIRQICSCACRVIQYGCVAVVVAAPLGMALVNAGVICIGAEGKGSPPHPLSWIGNGTSTELERDVLVTELHHAVEGSSQYLLLLWKLFRLFSMDMFQDLGAKVGREHDRLLNDSEIRFLHYLGVIEHNAYNVTKNECQAKELATCRSQGFLGNVLLATWFGATVIGYGASKIAGYFSTKKKGQDQESSPTFGSVQYIRAVEELQ